MDDIYSYRKAFLKKYPPWLTELGVTKLREMNQALGRSHWFFSEEVIDEELAQKILFAKRVVNWVLRGGVPLEHRK